MKTKPVLIFKAAAGAVGACGAMLLSSTAFAGAIDVWGFSTGSVALSCSGADKQTVTCDGTVDGNDSSLVSWGTPRVINQVEGEKSGLELLGGAPTPGFTTHSFNALIVETGLSVVDNDFAPLITGEWGNIGALVHYNNTMEYSPGTLRFLADIPLTLFPSADSSPEISVGNSTFLATVNETVDQDSCPAGGEGGSCDDRLIESEFNTLTFELDGIDYQIEFRLDPEFAEDRKEGGFIASDFMGDRYLDTVEGTAGLAFIQAKVTASSIPVPVPGVLGLIGLGGALLWGRRRQSAA